MKFNKDRNWLAKRAEQEDRHFISVGGLLQKMEAAMDEVVEDDIIQIKRGEYKPTDEYQ